MTNKVIHEITKTLINSPTTSTSEVFEALRIWGESIFGPGEPTRLIERAQEEMQELKDAVYEGWTDKAVEEAADVVIILTRVPGLWDAIVQKMNKNFDREWVVRGDGTGYHIAQDGG